MQAQSGEVKVAKRTAILVLQLPASVTVIFSETSYVMLTAALLLLLFYPK